MTPAGKTFSLRSDDLGQQRVSRFLTLLREAEDLKADGLQRESFRAGAVSFDAHDGSVVTQSVAQWRADMVSFGLQVLAIETQLANCLSAIAQAQNQGELLSITWID